MSLRVHAQRIVFEWGVIAAVSTVAGCLLLWFFSVTTGRTDFSMLIGLYGKLSATNGEITACQFLETWDDIAWEKINMAPGATSQAEWELPGLRFWYLDMPGGSRWIASVSLLLPALASSLFGTWFIFEYRRVRRRLAELPEPVATAPQAPCPLDLPD